MIVSKPRDVPITEDNWDEMVRWRYDKRHRKIAEDYGLTWLWDTVVQEVVDTTKRPPHRYHIAERWFADFLDSEVENRKRLHPRSGRVVRLEMTPARRRALASCLR